MSSVNMSTMTLRAPVPYLSGRTFCALVKTPSSSSSSYFGSKKNVPKVFGLKSSSFRVCATGEVYKVKVIGPDGEENEFDAPDDTYILDAADNAGLDLPSLCRAGTCSNCVAQLVSGSVDQSDQLCLDEQQVQKGYVLACVAYPKSDCVIHTHKESELM
ncbi:unnamed protein product [Lupinus luteus]|uniref:Ferredoxin n=1 Tax=Lupinus luteus TaxID=3873 RepID=A0AAV1XGG2_LUPLU